MNQSQQVCPEVQVGTVFVESWGYDQTNINFYRVVGRTKASVKIQEVRSATVTDSSNDFTSERVVATDTPRTYIDWSAVDQDADHWTQQEQKVERDAPVRTKRLQSGYKGRASIKVRSFSYAHLWNGEAVHQTASGFGH